MIRSIITDTFGTMVANAFPDKKSIDELSNIVSKYVDRYTVALSSIGPIKRPLFTEADKNAIFNLVGVTPGYITMMTKNIPEVKRSANVKVPFNILMAVIIRHFRITKNEQARKAACLYLILSMYPSIHAKYFKFEPNEQIMIFTINNLTSKFKFKQQGTILGAFADTVNVCEEHFASALVRGTDKDIADFILSVKTRINALIKNICNEFMKQWKSGNYLNYTEDNPDPDNFKVSDNNSFVIQNISNSVAINLSVNGANPKFIQVAAKMCDVSNNDLRTAVNALLKDKKNSEEIKEVVSAILYDFLFTGKHKSEEIRSAGFIVYSLETYKKSNTSNTNVVHIKEILDRWLKQYSTTYNKTNRIATLNCFRKAMYMFFIFTIQKTSF